LPSATHTGLPPREHAEPWLGDWWMLVLDNLASHLEGRGPGPRVDYTTLGGGEARVEADIDAPIERVYGALTEPAQLERWIAERATVELRVGGRYAYGWDEGAAKILELVPNRKLTHTWEWSGEDTVVSWELEGSGGRTHLTIVHSGFTSDVDSAGYKVGWTAFVARLKRMLEGDESWRPVERLEHTAS
jgi:uncharacterized protein YndB with AHSA1/START domain